MPGFFTFSNWHEAIDSLFMRRLPRAPHYRRACHGTRSAAQRSAAQRSAAYEKLPTVLAPLFAGLTLITASMLKAVDSSYAPANDQWLTARWTLVAAVWLLGVWLLTGLCARQARRVALACFVAFLTVSLYHVWRGETSCRCFGAASLHPLSTSGIDLAAVAILWWWRPAARACGDEACSFRRASLAPTGVVVVLIGAAAWQSRPTRLPSSGEIPGGPIILLEPETWVGGRFPLLSHIDVGDALSHGRWTVVLYRQDCPACRETIGRLRQAQGQVALIEMRSAGGPGRGKFALELSFTRGVLDPTKDWFVQAPVVVELDNGVALAATVGR